MVVKSANRTVIETVRPATPATRIRRGDLGGQLEQLAQHHLAVVDVATEGLLGAHRLVGVAARARTPTDPARCDLAPVGPPGQLVELAAEPVADRALQGAQRGVRDVADGDQPEPVQHRLGLLPHAVELTDVERVQERGDRLGRDDDHAVGLGPAAGQLGHRDRGGHPDRAGDALLVVDRGAQLLGDLDRRPEPPGRAADVEERLVEGDHLDQRGDPAEVLHHRRGDRAEQCRGRPRPRTACGHSRRARVDGMPERTP